MNLNAGRRRLEEMRERRRRYDDYMKSDEWAAKREERSNQKRKASFLS